MQTAWRKHPSLLQRNHRLNFLESITLDGRNPAPPKKPLLTRCLSIQSRTTASAGGGGGGGGGGGAKKLAPLFSRGFGGNRCGVLVVLDSPGNVAGRNQGRPGLNHAVVSSTTPQRSFVGLLVLPRFIFFTCGSSVVSDRGIKSTPPPRPCVLTSTSHVWELSLKGCTLVCAYRAERVLLPKNKLQVRLKVGGDSFSFNSPDSLILPGKKQGIGTPRGKNDDCTLAQKSVATKRLLHRIIDFAQTVLHSKRFCQLPRLRRPRRSSLPALGVEHHRRWARNGGF